MGGSTTLIRVRGRGRMVELRGVLSVMGRGTDRGLINLEPLVGEETFRLDHLLLQASTLNNIQLKTGES